jgi:hypothetical protein
VGAAKKRTATQARVIGVRLKPASLYQWHNEEVQKQLTILPRIIKEWKVKTGSCADLLATTVPWGCSEGSSIFLDSKAKKAKINNRRSGVAQMSLF